MSNCPSSCTPAPVAIYNRLTEILQYMQAEVDLDYYDTILGQILTELQAINAALGGAASPVTVTISQETNNSGTIAANWRSFTIINQGATTATVELQTIQPGTSLSAGDFGNSPTNAIDWAVGAGGDLLIIEARV